ncbi:MAG: right-handed parallel beta-helix repeat-containing protein, partial [Patescibacteria group bacterium]
MPRKKKTRKLARIGHLAIFLVAVSLTLLFYYGAFVFNWHGARAATYNYVVDSTDTQPDDNVGNGICHTAAGTCTLNAAVAEANADAGTTAITFSATGTITLNMAEVVTEPLTITGPGVASLTIAGGGLNPGIRFENSSTGSSISGITLTNTGTNACLSLAVSNLTVNAMAIACKTLLDGDNVTISNNAFTTINGYIVVPGANFNSPYTNLSFTGNSFNATAGSPDGGSYPIGGLTASLNDGITINNNTFTNFSANSIISVSGSNLTVTNNTVTSDGTGFSAAMFDLAPAGGTNTITGNTLTTAGGTKFRDGISISPSVASLTALNVSSNVISNNSRYGIIIEPSSGDLVLISATINSNNVTSNTQQGIYLNSLDAGSSVTFGSNISSTNGENGIYVGGGGGSLTFTGNTLNSSTADNGLDLQDYNGAVVATGNTMNNNGSSGFNLKNTTISSLTFSGNTITGNALGGVAVDGGASTLTLSDSNISSNVTADLALISGVGNTINADNTSFSTYLVMAGLLDANFKVRVRTMDHLGAAASSSTVTATDTASAATAMGTTGGTGYTSYYSLDAYQVNSTGVINQKNPYTFSATHATEGSASSAATTVGTQNQTVTINLPGENLTLTAPNGGEELTGTGTSAVTWTSVGTITNVKLEYSTDNFATATT